MSLLLSKIREYIGAILLILTILICLYFYTERIQEIREFEKNNIVESN